MKNTNEYGLLITLEGFKNNMIRRFEEADDKCDAMDFESLKYSDLSYRLIKNFVEAYKLRHNKENIKKELESIVDVANLAFLYWYKIQKEKINEEERLQSGDDIK